LAWVTFWKGLESFLIATFIPVKVSTPELFHIIDFLEKIVGFLLNFVKLEQVELLPNRALCPSSEWHEIPVSLERSETGIVSYFHLIEIPSHISDASQSD